MMSTDSLCGARLRGPLLILLLISVSSSIVLGPALAAENGVSEPRWLSMISTLAGGLALFLFGLELMSDGLKAVAGAQMKTLLAKMTSNRVMGALTGAFVTAVVQSSSVTTVLVVGFVGAGLMSLAQSISIIMGANIGTTITAQIVAFKVTKIALPLIAIGFAMNFISERERTRQFGSMIMGFGLIFFGMTIMGHGMKPLQTYQPFIDFMSEVQRPLFGILVGAAFTALVQSSSATTAIIVVLASQGLISLPGGIAMAIGANIGTCVTALLASLGKPREAVRAAYVHVLFNVGGALIWIGLIDYLADIAAAISPVAEGLQGTQKLAAETPRQIANANTLFNVINTLIFLPFTVPLARLVERLVPDRPAKPGEIVEAKYLDEALVGTPSLALQRARLEIGNLGSRVTAMLAALQDAIQRKDYEQLKAVRKLDNEVDILRNRIVEYLGLVARQPLTEQEGDSLVEAMSAADDLEEIGNAIQADLANIGTQLLEENIAPSETTRLILSEMYQATSRAVEAAVTAVEKDDQLAAQEVIAAKSDLGRMEEAALRHQAEQMRKEGPDRLAHHRVEVSLIQQLRRIYSLARRIAKLNLPPSVLEDVA